MNASPVYDIGSPRLQEIWVDPVAGRDENDGSSRSNALRTINAAWSKIPAVTAVHGYRIVLCPGTYAVDADGHINLTHRRGSFQAPIILEPAEGARFELPPLDVIDCSYVYVLRLTFASTVLTHIPSSDDNVLHFADCDHILLRDVTGIGQEKSPGLPRIVLKANQCSHLYVEDCEFSGANSYVNAYVAVQYGHIVRSKFRRSNFAGLCVKGGSAYQLIAGNEVDDCRIVGIEIGEGTGCPYLVAPWLHYEAYEIKAVNNVVSNSGGAVCVGGGYNIVAAYNTGYRVGANRDTLLVTLGAHAWVGGREADASERFYKMGGWCTPKGDTFIPNRNIQICNNVVFNPPGYESQFAHFAASGPMPSKPGSNVPGPIGTTNLRIEGNVIWNGGPDKPVLDDVENMYGLAARPTIDPEELRRINRLNTLRPELDDSLRPAAGSNLREVKAVALRDFIADAPNPVPAGDPDNSIGVDKDGKPRGDGVGAYA